MRRNAVQRSATIRWRSSFAGGCAYLILLISLAGCGDTQSSDRQGSAPPTKRSDTSTTRSDTSMARSDKPRTGSEKHKAHPTTKQQGSEATGAANVTGKRHTPAGDGSDGDTKGIASCLKTRGYGQTRTLATPAPGGGGKKAPFTVVPLIIGPPRKPRVVATLVYLASASQAKRLAKSIKARVRSAGMGAYQVNGARGHPIRARAGTKSLPSYQRLHRLAPRRSRGRWPVIPGDALSSVPPVLGTDTRKV